MALTAAESEHDIQHKWDQLQADSEFENECTFPKLKSLLPNLLTGQMGVSTWRKEQKVPVHLIFFGNRTSLLPCALDPNDTSTIKIQIKQCDVAATTAVIQVTLGYCCLRRMD
jgi:hypothetical protein